MNGGVLKARIHGPRVKLSKTLQEKLLDAVASKGGGMHIVDNVFDLTPGEW
jgi:hypothetical protein